MVNFEWANKISQFIKQYPEFEPYLYLVPLNPIEPIPYTNVNNLFQAIMHYICAVGVRYSYAINQWTFIYDAINKETWEEILSGVEQIRINPNIQPKKREIYYNLCKFMDEQELTHETITTKHLKLLQQNIKGIGDGCIAWCRKYFTYDDDCVEYTDIYFKKGFKKIYGNDNLKNRKMKAQEFVNNGFGRIANLMILAISS